MINIFGENTCSKKMVANKFLRPVIIADNVVAIIYFWSEGEVERECLSVWKMYSQLIRSVVEECLQKTLSLILPCVNGYNFLLRIINVDNISVSATPCIRSGINTTLF